MKKRIPTEQLLQKYNMSKKTLYVRISEIFTPLKPFFTLEKARDYLQDEDIDDVLNKLMI